MKFIIFAFTIRSNILPICQVELPDRYFARSFLNPFLEKRNDIKIMPPFNHVGPFNHLMTFVNNRPN